MSLATNLTSFATRVATEFKVFRTLITGSGTGTLAGLSTTDKSSVVGAINEVKAAVGAGSPTTLDDLTDVAVTTPATGHILRYDTATNTFVNVLGTSYFQPTDADLTAIAALTTTAYGRAFLTLADQAALMGLVATATTTAQGIVELATTAETTTGTDTVRAVTPAGVKAVADTKAPLVHTHQLSDIPDAWVKRSVRVGTTAAVTLTAAPSTVDGVALAVNDRVLVKNQAAPAQNGIYVVTTVGTGANGTWTRATDADIASEIAGGVVNIDQGTQGGQLWSTTFKTTDTLGTTAMVWARMLDTTMADATGGYATFGHLHDDRYYTETEADARYQPLDSDLTAIAGLTTTTYGRALLSLANQAALMGLLSAASETASGIIEIATQSETTTGTDDVRAITPLKLAQRLSSFQPLDSDLTSIAALSTTAFGRSLLTMADATATKTTLGLATVATSGSAADLTGTLPTSVLPPLAINETFTAASQAAMLALVAQRGDMAIRTDNGRTYVLSTDSPSTLADWKEVLAAGQVQSVNGNTGIVVLSKSDVGLGNVDNTSDASKPVSTATQTALDGKQPLDAELTALAGLTSAADRLPYFTGANTASLATFTAFGRSLVDDADAAAARTTLGLGTAATSASTAFQPTDATLTALAGLVTAANQMVYSTGVDAFAMTSLTAFGRSLIDDADAATARATLAVYSTTEIGDPETDLVATFNAGLL